MISNLYRPNRMKKAVFSSAEVFVEICQYPLAKSRVDRIFAAPTLLKISSTRDIGYASKLDLESAVICTEVNAPIFLRDQQFRVYTQGLMV